jgi:hypothetical protein
VRMVLTPTNVTRPNPNPAPDPTAIGAIRALLRHPHAAMIHTAAP